jgi:hypothetical protein
MPVALRQMFGDRSGDHALGTCTTHFTKYRLTKYRRRSRSLKDVTQFTTGFIVSVALRKLPRGLTPVSGRLRHATCIVRLFDTAASIASRIQRHGAVPRVVESFRWGPLFRMDAYRFPALQFHTMKKPAKAITCPQCSSPMSLALAPGGKEPHSLRCEQCDRPDPLMTVEAAGWLRGELRPPK